MIYLIERCYDTRERDHDWAIYEDYGYFETREDAEAKVAELKAPADANNNRLLDNYNRAIAAYEKKKQELAALGGEPVGGRPCHPTFDYSDYGIIEVELAKS